MAQRYTIFFKPANLFSIFGRKKFLLRKKALFRWYSIDLVLFQYGFKWAVFPLHGGQ